MPLWLWLSGAGASIILTFIVMALFVRDARPQAVRRIHVFSASGWTVGLLRWVAVLLFLLSLAAGFFGAQDPYRNVLPTMVWVVWWVGFAFVCALVGNLWALVNPLATLFNFRGRLPYPARLGAWPAVVLFFAFAWAELVWRDNDVPYLLAWAVLAYSALTGLAMFLFGRSAWLQNGEAFHIAFGVLGRFAPLEGGAGEVRLRMPGAGLLEERPPPPGMMVFVILMLATVTFDGLLETPLYQQWSTALQQVPAAGRLLFFLSEFGLDESEWMATTSLLAVVLAFIAAYRLAALGMGKAAAVFVLSLVPIAVAYHLAHYFSLLLTAGQFIIPLASDPFGFGWDLFGTGGYKVDLGIVNPYVFWYSAVALIVAGHAIAVFVAHIQAVRHFGSAAAMRSQLPMMALMVAYTTLSLWILAQPIVG